jgi:biotin carboxylase
MKRILILASKLGYQTRSFAEAARRLGLQVMLGTDRCHQLDDPWADGALALNFADPHDAAKQILASARTRPPEAILPLGDAPTCTAAIAAAMLKLPCNDFRAAEICGNKLEQRKLFKATGVPVPQFLEVGLGQPLAEVIPRVPFPCVVKPLGLSASQGVIRANTAEEFTAAVQRIGALLRSPEIQVRGEPGLDRVLVEQYIPGREVAVEGVLTAGKLRVLAIFDKPDPLEGPYFEETIYVTPSRLSVGEQNALIGCARRATCAIGLSNGPVHAELRINEHGPWVLEVAARPIGGLCARALRFGSERIPLEELLVRHALGLPGSDAEREPDASGVMMIPVPHSGVYEGVAGLEEARATPHVTDIEITARVHDALTAWPEGSSYLGFIFARAEKPEQVEAALRTAHARLRFTISPRLPVAHPAAR